MLFNTKLACRVSGLVILVLLATFSNALASEGLLGSGPERGILSGSDGALAALGDADAGTDDRDLGLSSSQWDLAQDLRAVAHDPTRSSRERMVGAAELALDHRRGLVGAPLHPSLGPLLDDQRENLRVANEVLDRSPAGRTLTLSEAVEQARHLTVEQGRSLGFAVSDTRSPPTHAHPQEAVRGLLDAHAVKVPDHTAQRLALLDALPGPLAGALTETIDAYMRFEIATQTAYAAADAASLADLLAAGEDASMGLGPDLFLRSDVDLAPLLGARLHLLDATERLHQALQEHQVPSSFVCEPLQVPPVLSIELLGCDTVYTEDLHLVIDAGGGDTYHNNAGGSGLTRNYVPCPPEDPPLLPSVPCGTSLLPLPSAAALLDLGLQGDVFGDVLSPRDGGTNGGGTFLGAGFLVSTGGDDRYAAGGSGTNGGGTFLGVGFLLDVAGNDQYDAASYGTNGGGNLATGLLIDTGGHDHYGAGKRGTNGGGWDGAGFLVDLAGDDRFVAGERGTNGGASEMGAGFLLSGAGSDSYYGLSGTNGGVHYGGTGFLLDAGGNTAYEGYYYGSNGGAIAERHTIAGIPRPLSAAVGFLMDLGGDNTFTAATAVANGGAAVYSAGFLFSGEGDDTYTGQSAAVNGGAVRLGVGFVYDAAGDDTYTARSDGVNGGSASSGLGFLFDATGNDRYVASCCAANGAAAGRDSPHTLGAGLLFDAHGSDYYEDADVPGGSCYDCTLFPKGTRNWLPDRNIGIQADLGGSV